MIKGGEWLPAEISLVIHNDRFSFLQLLHHDDRWGVLLVGELLYMFCILANTTYVLMYTIVGVTRKMSWIRLSGKSERVIVIF